MVIFAHMLAPSRLVRSRETRARCKSSYSYFLVRFYSQTFHLNKQISIYISLDLGSLPQVTVSNTYSGELCAELNQNVLDRMHAVLDIDTFSV